MSDLYTPDVFYATKHLSIEDKKSLLIDAKELSYHWHINKHDHTYARKWVKYARFKTMLNRLDESCHFVFINRNGYESWKNSTYKDSTFCLEIGFCTMCGEDWFLFINVDLKHLDFFINKYKLVKQ